MVENNKVFNGLVLNSLNRDYFNKIFKKADLPVITDLVSYLDNKGLMVYLIGDYASRISSREKKRSDYQDYDILELLVPFSGSSSNVFKELFVGYSSDSVDSQKVASYHSFEKTEPLRNNSLVEVLDKPVDSLDDLRTVSLDALTNFKRELVPDNKVDFLIYHPKNPSVDKLFERDFLAQFVMKPSGSDSSIHLYFIN